MQWHAATQQLNSVSTCKPVYLALRFTSEELHATYIYLLDKSGTESDTALLHRQENEDEGKMGPT